MRIAVIGSGIAGLASAWLLSRLHEVVLYEQSDYLGGHTHTHTVSVDGRQWTVDTGFIVSNPGNYPLFYAMLDELGVATQPSTMSFSVRNERSGLEYAAGSLNLLFVQRRRLASLRHWRMIADILRFYREAPALLTCTDPGPELGDYLDANGYSAGFAEDHLIPMASALWSSPSDQVRRFPAKYLVRFMANHHMLKVEDRPQWRTVVGGSQAYVRALRARWQAQARLGCRVLRVRREGTRHVTVEAQGAEPERYDHVVLACHSDQALGLIDAPSAAEREVLGAIGYQHNDTVLHTDASQLPRNPKAWAAWNALIPGEPGQACTVSYCMNILQRLDAPLPFIVTLNRTAAIDPARIIARMSYHHPVYSHASVAAQARRAEINGVNRLWYAGAYWGFGFHEDGMRSAVEIANALGVRWPARTAAAA